MSEFVRAASMDEIPENTAILVEFDDREIAVFNIGGEFYAIDNECTHQGGPLCEGAIEESEVICPWHGAVFDVKSGEVRGPPAGDNVRSYRVRVNGADVEVEV